MVFIQLLRNRLNTGTHERLKGAVDSPLKVVSKPQKQRMCHTKKEREDREEIVHH